jgi:Uma2 family endonuclease
MTLVKESTREEQRQEQRIPMSYEEFQEFINEDTHAEWVNGEAIIFMAASPLHQRFVRFLLTILSAFVGFSDLGEVFPAPMEMKVRPDANGREPDIIFVAKENLARVTKQKLEGPADLVVEIISDDSVSRDRDDKFYEYQEAGIPEYWIFDPRPGRQRADFYVLDARGRYRPVPLNEDDIYHSTVLPGFWIDVNWLWQDEQSDPIRTLAQIIGPENLIAALEELKHNS